MRAARRSAAKAVKKYKIARRGYRLQRRRRMMDQVRATEAAKPVQQRRRIKRGYHYERQGHYGDVELVPDAKGKPLRTAQLRATGAISPSCLPTALLALSKAHTQEVRLDSCAQFSVADRDLRKYGRCITRNAPVDVVLGFGGGQTRVLGVWRFTGTTVYQQRITVDALLVDGQGDEFLVGEDWMADKQVKMDFGSRELKYREADGQKVILPFTCHGVTTLQQAGERQANVRLAKTVKMPTNTLNLVRVKVDAPDGTTGVFVPKPSSKRHLMMSPTAATVHEGVVRVAVLNIEGKREKLPAREVLGTWVPTDDTMQMLSLNGELEKARVKE
ncbi:hypothetical protein PF007_g28263 [Phytophthora fragariae]|uniref:Uncharacterized protein n=2 Tax=Phytophthora fragariae TaxID=53985 RepID=A0A6A3Q1X6_9STRA|nr:hypothetical protein PF007_g28263 [Phytophthora fragariae]